MRTSRRSGFTIVELSLAILLVSVLTLAIMQVAMQIMKVYSKGFTIKSANQAARDVGDQIKRDLHAAPVQQINTTQVAQRRLCIGSITYLWNTTSVLNSGATKIVNATNTPVRLLRIFDPSQKFCATPLTYAVANSYQPTELLGNTTNNLAVFSLQVSRFITTAPIYTIDYTIGTNDTSAVAGTQCKPPTDNQANFDFCTVAEFHTIVKASEAGGS